MNTYFDPAPLYIERQASTSSRYRIPCQQNTITRSHMRIYSIANSRDESEGVWSTDFNNTHTRHKKLSLQPLVVKHHASHTGSTTSNDHSITHQLISTMGSLSSRSARQNNWKCRLPVEIMEKICEHLTNERALRTLASPQSTSSCCHTLITPFT